MRIGQFHTPTANNSDLPGLLGLRTLRHNRAVLDFNTLQLHFCGPGNYDLHTGLPPNTESFQCEIAPSGHIVLPCCEYEVTSASNDSPLTFVNRSNLPQRSSSSTDQTAVVVSAAAAGAGAATATWESLIPPPPRLPPRLPSLIEQVWQIAKIREMSRWSGVRLGNEPRSVQAVPGSIPSRAPAHLVANIPADSETS